MYKVVGIAGYTWMLSKKVAEQNWWETEPYYLGAVVSLVFPSTAPLKC
jgi:hypothetical protein